jgi:hypothetical protein
MSNATAFKFYVDPCKICHLHFKKSESGVSDFFDT